MAVARKWSMTIWRISGWIGICSKKYLSGRFLDEVTIRSDFRQLATDSVYYLLSRRCGLDPMELLEKRFHAYYNYNHLSVLTFLGNAASQLIESILIDID